LGGGGIRKESLQLRFHPILLFHNILKNYFPNQKERRNIFRQVGSLIMSGSEKIRKHYLYMKQWFNTKMV